MMAADLTVRVNFDPARAIDVRLSWVQACMITVLLEDAMGRVKRDDAMGMTLRCAYAELQRQIERQAPVEVAP